MDELIPDKDQPSASLAVTKTCHCTFPSSITITKDSLKPYQAGSTSPITDSASSQAQSPTSSKLMLALSRIFFYFQLFL